MSVTREELVALLGGLEERMKFDVKRNMDELKIDVASVKSDLGSVRTEVKSELGSVTTELSTVKRTVNAMEAAPQPYGRPKTYHSVTEAHSVSDARRFRQGYQG